MMLIGYQVRAKVYSLIDYRHQRRNFIVINQLGSNRALPLNGN
jgi:hypothetical protein